VSTNRGFFYVWANKIGTVVDATGQFCVEGNYWPCWALGLFTYQVLGAWPETLWKQRKLFTYQVLGAWPETLWKQRKLTAEVYQEYLYLTRDGVVGRKRNLDEVLREEERLSLQAEIEANTKRIRSDPSLFQRFPTVPEATAWLKLFGKDAARYPVLVVLGPSLKGKTEYAKSLFKNPLELKLGPLEHFPDGFRAFKRGVHDGVVLDDVRDLAFLTNFQDKLQGKYDALLEFGSTPGGQCTYYKYLFKTPVVLTATYSTRNLAYVDTNDWLGKPGSRVLLHYQGVDTQPANS
jgi:hypothetical protein